MLDYNSEIEQLKVDVESLMTRTDVLEADVSTLTLQLARLTHASS